MSTDPRTTRTVDALRSALRQALTGQSLDEISVSDLCRRAGVRRTTFYTHFASVADLLTAMLTSEIDVRFADPDAATLTIPETAEAFHAGLVDVLEAMLGDRLLFRAGFASDASAPLRRALTAMLARRLEHALAIWQAHGTALDVDPELAVAYAAGGLAAALESWALASDTDAVRWADTIRDQLAPWWPRS